MEINLTGRSTKKFKTIYQRHEQGGMTLAIFTKCLQSLSIIDNKQLSPEDIHQLFYEATNNAEIADFEVFLRALSLVSLKRYPPQGIDDDPNAALERLLDVLDQEEDEEEINKKKKAVYDAKRRAAQRAKAMRQKEKSLTGEIKEKTEEEKNDELQERLSKEKIAKQRAYLRVKARIRAQKEAEKNEEEKRKEEELHRAEKELTLKKLRIQARKKTMQRTKQRLAEFKKQEDEALALKNMLLLNTIHSEETRQEAVKKAEERVKKAVQARKNQELLEQIEKEKNQKAEMELKEHKEKMTNESYKRATERAKDRLKAKMRAEEEEFERMQRIVIEKMKREDKIVAAARTKAAKRSSTKKIKIDLDEETIADLHKMFDPMAQKEKLYKARWFEFIQKYKLSDGIFLKRSELDGIFSKASKKGTKGMEFKHFCKAVSMVGNKRFPVKKNTDPNDAIERVLQATVRKHDPEKLKKRKKEMREKKKNFIKSQRLIENQKQQSTEEESKKALEEQKRNRKRREERIQQQLEQLEIDKKQRAEKARKRAIIEERKEMKKLEEMEKTRQEQKKVTETKNAEIEKDRKEAEKRTKERLKKHAEKQSKMEKKKKLEKEQREAKSAKAAEEGRKKALKRVLSHKKKEVRLGKEDENNLRTLFDHYTSGTGFKRADWLNCTVTLGLMDGTLVMKSDLDRFFVEVMDKGAAGIEFQQFCIAMGFIAQRTHPGKDENSPDHAPSKCLERLLFDIMGGGESGEMDFDATVDDSVLKGYEESEEEKAARLKEERAKRRKRREARKRREKEAQERAEEEARIEEKKKQIEMEKIEHARKEAAKRVLKKRKDNFNISEKDKENLEVLYDYFQISPSGMSRADWLNCTSTLGIQDEDVIKKIVCEQTYEEVCTKKTRGITVEQFGLGMSLLAVRKYEGKLNQTKALSRLMGELMDGE